MLAYLLLALAQVLGLALIPFGLPGLWLQVGALAAYAWWTGFTTVSAVPIVLMLLLALLAEAAEFLLAGRFARRHGGGRRAEIGAVVGGMAGAVIGLPLPLLGSVFGALLGAFVGAAVFQLTAGRGVHPAVRAGWGALLGRIVATAMKGGVGVVTAIFALYVAWR